MQKNLFVFQEELCAGTFLGAVISRNLVLTVRFPGNQHIARAHSYKQKQSSAYIQCYSPNALLCSVEI